MTDKEKSGIIGLGLLGLLAWLFTSSEDETKTIDVPSEVVEEPKALSGIAGGRDVEAGGMTFTRINNDVNGNPRYVIHFLNLLKDGEKGYETALKRARKIGGKKFSNKQYGGGIVFQSYNINRTAERIKELLTESDKPKNKLLKGSYAEKAKMIQDEFNKLTTVSGVNQLYTILEKYGVNKNGMVPEQDTSKKQPWRITGMNFWDSKGKKYLVTLPDNIKLFTKLDGVKKLSGKSLYRGHSPLMIARIKEKFDSLTNLNNHTEAAILLVNNFGTVDERDTLVDIKEKQEKRGSITESEQKKRDAISNKYYYKYLKGKLSGKSKKKS